MKNIYFSILVLFAGAMNIQESKATTYTFISISAANWTNASKWTPSYPGTNIDAGDEVIITGICHLNTNVNIEGTLTVDLFFLKVNSGKTLTIDSGGTFNNDATLRVDGTLDINNSGTFTQMSSAVVKIYGVLNNDGSVTVNSGKKLTIKSGGIFTQSSSSASISGTLKNEGTVTVSGGDLTIQNGGDLTIQSGGDLAIESGGDLTIENGGDLTIETGGDLVIESGGTFTHAGSSASIEGTLTNIGTLTVNSDKTLTIESGGTFYHAGFSASIEGTLTNIGTVQVNSAKNLTVNGTFNNNGLLQGHGTINGTANFTNPAGGTVGPGTSPGCFNFDTNFTNSGTLDIELADGNACDDFDRIVVTGDATVDGTIDISYIDDIEPNETTFTILTATGTISGNPTINWPAGYTGSYSICTSCSPKELEVTFDSPLPVELTYFRASQLADNEVGLEWQTASEENNLGFEIQHSNNSQDWETLGFVEGSGTSVSFSNYNFQDESPANGDNYYRLKQMDFDGVFEFSEIRAVDINRSTPDIAVYPNPTTDELHIDLGQSSISLSQNNGGSIQLFNSLGKLILAIDATENESSQILHLKDYQKGIYSLLITIDRDVFTKQIILQ